MGLGYVYMDLPYGNKKERMEPKSALCWKSEQARQSLWLHRADKVTLAIKSLHFHQNIRVRQSKTAQTNGGTYGKIAEMRLCLPADHQAARIHTLLHLASFN